MISEAHLEQLAIQWFQETGWNYVHGSVIAPEGKAVEREDYRAVVLKGRLAEAVRLLNPKLPGMGAELAGGDGEEFSWTIAEEWDGEDVTIVEYHPSAEAAG